MVRFSPNIPSGSARPSRSPHASSSSRAKAYTACWSPPWFSTSPTKSPSTPLPSPPCLGPGARSTALSTGRLPIPVLGTPFAEFGSGDPTLSDSTWAGMATTLGRRRPQGRASNTRLNGVSATRRKRVKPASVTTWRIAASPAWAPSAYPPGWDIALGTHRKVEKP